MWPEAPETGHGADMIKMGMGKAERRDLRWIDSEQSDLFDKNIGCGAGPPFDDHALRPHG